MADEDRKYSSWIRSLDCAMCGARGPSEQHHKSGAGVGRRAHDHDSMPLCRKCHHERLGKMQKSDRRLFEAAAIAIYTTRARMGLGPWTFEHAVRKMPDPKQVEFDVF